MPGVVIFLRITPHRGVYEENRTRAGRPGQRIPPHPHKLLPSETPDEFKAPVDSFDYIKRTVMIPMRDGVKLNTVIVIPRKARNAPMLLTRTPYNAADMTSHAESSQMDVMLQGYDNLPDVIGRAAISAWCRMCAASTARRAIM
jgi:predicted acyl esterase